MTITIEYPFSEYHAERQLGLLKFLVAECEAVIEQNKQEELLESSKRMGRKNKDKSTAEQIQELVDDNRDTTDIIYDYQKEIEENKKKIEALRALPPNEIVYLKKPAKRNVKKVKLVDNKEDDNS